MPLGEFDSGIFIKKKVRLMFESCAHVVHSIISSIIHSNIQFKDTHLKKGQIFPLNL